MCLIEPMFVWRPAVVSEILMTRLILEQYFQTHDPVQRERVLWDQNRERRSYILNNITFIGALLLLDSSVVWEGHRPVSICKWDCYVGRYRECFANRPVSRAFISLRSCTQWHIHKRSWFMIYHVTFTFKGLHIIHQQANVFGNWVIARAAK